MGLTHTEIFTPQYRERSGPGSTIDYSAPYRAFLEEFIRDRGVRSVLDLPCGDGVVMGAVDLQGASYLGVDVIEARVARNRDLYQGREFLCADLTTWQIPTANLVVCKDLLQHWSTPEVQDFLARIRHAPIRWALITNCNYGPSVNTEIASGGWRALDITAPPFNVGQVVYHWETKDVVLIPGADA